MSNVAEIIAQAKRSLAAQQTNLQQWEEQLAANADTINGILASKPIVTPETTTPVSVLMLRVPQYQRVPGSQGRFVDPETKHFSGRSEDVFSQEETSHLAKFGLCYSTAHMMKI